MFKVKHKFEVGGICIILNNLTILFDFKEVGDDNKA